MKPNTQSATRDIWKLAMLGASAALAFGLACSTTHKVSSSSPEPMMKPQTAARPALLKTVAVVSPAMPNMPADDVVTAKVTPSKPVAFRSRDYGVSFQYPWQYAYFSARAIANGDDSLKPAPDGHDGQITLARVAIPRGFYPDTDFESAYFTLGLNQNIAEEDCAVLAAKREAVKKQSINGVDFQWSEADTGGHGEASKVRNYTAFANGTCYEVEMGLKTSNQDGLAREVNPDQVFSRLESILQTVKIHSELKDPAPTQTATAAPPIQN